MPQYWLMKSEPDVFSIDDLKARRVAFWDGVRNYMARNYMVRDMKVGDLVLFYHSNANPSAAVGIARVASPAKPDPTQFDKKSDYFDPKATVENPRWLAVEVEYVDSFKHPVPLDLIKRDQSLKDMVLLNNSRLSVQPVKKSEFEHICKLAMSSAARQ